MAKIEDIQLGSGGKRMRIRSVVPPSETIAPLVSVDDHLLEPANIFENRLPHQFRARAPRIVRLDGVDHWTFEDTSVPLQSGDAMVTWEPEDYQLQPVSIDDVRAGTWNVDDRIKDMDIAGIAASLSFPSSIFGFCGHRFYRFKDEQLGLASLRAYNDWMIEEWAGSYPDRLISTQIAWLPDPEVAASDIYLNFRTRLSSTLVLGKSRKTGTRTAIDSFEILGPDLQGMRGNEYRSQLACRVVFRDLRSVLRLTSGRNVGAIRS